MVVAVFNSTSVDWPTRAPAIVRLNSGVLLAFAASLCSQASPSTCEFDANRVKPQTWLSRSADHGSTWTAPTLLAVPDGYEGPQPIYDPRSDTVFVMLSWLYPSESPGPAVKHCSRCVRSFITSRDAGVTWSPISNLSSVNTTKPGGDPSLDGLGLTHGIALRSGHLASPLRDSSCRDDCPPLGTDKCSLQLSSDAGASWAEGGTAPFGGESALCELDNGSLLLTARGDGTHHFARSDDGGGSWAAAWSTTALGLNTQASLVCVPSATNGTDVYFLTPAYFGGAGCFGAEPQPAAPTPDPVEHAQPNNHNRCNLTISVSEDGGQSWASHALVYAGLGGYSDMAWLPEINAIGVLFERGVEGPQGMQYVGVSFTVVKVKG